MKLICYFKQLPEGVKWTQPYNLNKQKQKVNTELKSLIGLKKIMISNNHL